MALSLHKSQEPSKVKLRISNDLCFILSFHDDFLTLLIGSQGRDAQKRKWEEVYTATLIIIMVGIIIVVTASNTTTS